MEADTGQPGQAGEIAQTGWSLMLPDTWSRIRLERDRPQQVAALVDRAFASVSRDQGVALRRSMQVELTGLADRAFEQGAREFYLFGDLMRGLPIGASCVVTVVPEAFPANVDAAILARALAGDAAAVPTTVTVGAESVPAVQTREVRYFPAEEPGGQQPRATVVGLDVYAPFPDRSRILLLSFRTPVEQVAEAMLVLFEAIAGSLRWREA